MIKFPPITQDTVWATHPPMIDNIIEVYTFKLQNPRNPVFSFGIIARMRFDLVCPKHEANPHVDLLITQDPNVIKNPPSEFPNLLTSEKSSYHAIIPAGLDSVGLDSIIKADYNNLCIFFDESSYLKKPESEPVKKDFNVDATLIFDWGGEAPLGTSQYSPLEWDNYGFMMVKTMNILNVRQTDQYRFLALTIITNAIFDKINPNPQLTLAVIGHDGKPVSHRPGPSSFNQFYQAYDNDYSGIDCEIMVDNDTGCVFFNDYYDTQQNICKAVLSKPNNEKTPGANDFEIGDCRIFDWKGKPFPPRPGTNF
jgi:hypothetical protein